MAGRAQALDLIGRKTAASQGAGLKLMLAEIEAFAQANKPFGLVCHAPGVLRHVNAGDGQPLVRGVHVLEERGDVALADRGLLGAHPLQHGAQFVRHARAGHRGDRSAESAGTAAHAGDRVAGGHAAGLAALTPGATPSSRADLVIAADGSTADRAHVVRSRRVEVAAHPSAVELAGWLTEPLA